MNAHRRGLRGTLLCATAALLAPLSALAQRAPAVQPPAPTTAACLAAGVPPAQNPTPAQLEQARARLQLGVALLQDNRFAEAMTELRQARDLRASPNVLFNLGLAQRGAGHAREAMQSFRCFLDVARERADGPLRTQVQQAITELGGTVGRLEVRVEPSTARIQLDGEAVDVSGGPLELDPGTHVVVATAEGFTPETTRVELARGGTSQVQLRLAPIRTMGRLLEVDVNVPGVEVRLDGQRVGETPLPGPLTVGVGTHQLTLLRAGYELEERTVAAEGNLRLAVRMNPRDPLPAEVAGSLRVRSNEREARVQLDGRAIAQEALAPTPEGRHRVRVELQDFEASEQEVSVPRGQTRELRVNLRPLPGFRERYLAAARVRMGVGAGTLAAGLAMTAVGGLFLGLTLGPRGMAEFNLNATSAQYMMGGGNSANPVCPTQLAPPMVIASLAQHRLPDGTIDPGFLQSTFTAPGGMQRFYSDLLGCQVSADAVQADGGNYPLFLPGIALTTIGVAGAIAGAVLVATAPSLSRFDRRAALPVRFAVVPGLGSLSVLGSF